MKTRTLKIRTLEAAINKQLYARQFVRTIMDSQMEKAK